MVNYHCLCYRSRRLCGGHTRTKRLSSVWWEPLHSAALCCVCLLWDCLHLCNLLHFFFSVSTCLSLNPLPYRVNDHETCANLLLEAMGSKIVTCKDSKGRLVTILYYILFKMKIHIWDIKLRHLGTDFIQYLYLKNTLTCWLQVITNAARKS